MPAAPAAPPPSAPAPTQTPAKPAPAPTPQPPVAPGKAAFSDAFEALDRFAEAPDQGHKPGKPVDVPKAQPKPEPPKPTEAPKIDANVEEQPAGEETTPPAEAPKPGEKPGKVSPWRLVEDYKSKVTMLQKEIADFKANPASHPEFKEIMAKREAAEKRAAELEERIRFIDYSQSKEYIDQYQKPYNEAWAKAVAEIKELNIETEDGTSRPATAQDMIALCNMSKREARTAAEAWFGEKFADEVMSYRREIRDLAEKQNKALEEAKTRGGQHEQQQREQVQKAQQVLDQEIATVWKAANDEAMQKYDFLKAIEGDTERNEKLEKAIAFVDEAFGASARDPNLTPQQRAEVIKKHAALRNRAIAYTPLLQENKKLRAQLAEKEKALAAYQQSEPGRGNGTTHRLEEQTSSDPMQAALDRLEKLAT